MVFCLGELPRRFLWCSSLCFCSSFCFYSSCHFRATLWWSATLVSLACEGLHQLWALPRLLLIVFSFSSTASATVWLGIFYPLTFFTLRSFTDTDILNCVYQGFPGSRQFLLEVCRDSYWSSKHRLDPSVCLIHSNPLSFIHLKFVSIHVNISKVLLVVKTLVKKYYFFGSVLDKIRLSSRSATTQPCFNNKKYFYYYKSSIGKWGF